jgi:polysaccharide export outer membrane protein
MPHVRCAVVCLALLSAPLSAQTPEQLRLLRENPELASRYLAQSGLTPEQIRQRLEEAGYSPSVLDPLLETQADEQLSEEQARALAALRLGSARQLQAFADSTRREALLSQGRERGPDSLSLQVFGLDVFRRSTTQFAPDLAGPVHEGYRLGPGDVLVLILSGQVESARTLEVSRAGFIVVPRVGQLPVANLTMEQLRSLLRGELGRYYSGIEAGTTRFDVTLVQTRMIQVYVVGEVVRPGGYPIPSVGTVVTALYQANGPTERANFRSITVRRGSDTVASVDLYDYLLTGSAAGDVRLESGDVIFVPVHGPRVAISGAVVRPAIYELAPGETLANLVDAAGGFRPDAMLERVAVHRILPASERAPGLQARVVIDVPLENEGRTGEREGGRKDGSRDGAAFSGVVVPGLPLAGGDSVVVDSVGPLTESLFVEITGAVRRRGMFAWREGMTLKDLVRLARGPDVGADLREAEVARLPAGRDGGELAEALRVPLDSSYLLLGDSLGGYRGAAGVVFAASGSAPEFALQPFDHVTILKQPEFELQRRVVVSGEVRYPGTYALRRKDERLSELVARAGGVLPTAYEEGGRFFRQLDTTVQVNLELGNALGQPGSRFDLILQPGDSLHVPEYNPVVAVTGAVNSPTTVLYREGAGLEYYIENAGGYAPGAHKGRVSVRYANGSARVKREYLMFSSTPTPEPGSTVFVPTRAPGAGVELRGLIRDIVAITGSVTTLIVVLTR